MWGQGEEQSDEPHLKQGLTSAPVLAHFSEELPTAICTDGRSCKSDAVLFQTEYSAEHVVLYVSRSPTQAERNYSTTERECAAIVWAVSKFQRYFCGCFFFCYNRSPFLTLAFYHEESAQ